MKAKITKLIDVKSLVTITLTLVFAFLSVRRDLSPDQVLTVYTMIISFYFGTQSEKSKAGDKGD